MTKTAAQLDREIAEAIAMPQSPENRLRIDDALKRRHLVEFDRWKDVLNAALRGEALWYHAPMDRSPQLVSVKKIFKNGNLRIFGGDVTFTADAGHLDRFRRRG